MSRIQALELDQDGTMDGDQDGLLHQRENGLMMMSQEGLSNTLINDLYFDDEGILWVSTMEEELMFFWGNMLLIMTS